MKSYTEFVNEARIEQEQDSYWKKRGLNTNLPDNDSDEVVISRFKMTFTKLDTEGTYLYYTYNSSSGFFFRSSVKPKFKKYENDWNGITYVENEKEIKLVANDKLFTYIQYFDDDYIIKNKTVDSELLKYIQTI